MISSLQMRKIYLYEKKKVLMKNKDTIADYRNTAIKIEQK